MPGLVSTASSSTLASLASGSSTLYATSSSSDKSRRSSISGTGLLADMSNCKYDIVEKSLLQCGYETVKDSELLPESCDTHLVWMDTGVTAKTLAMLKPWQIINHFPEMSEICRKDCLARNLTKMQMFHPDEYDFFPRTIKFPIDFTKLKSYQDGRSLTYIAKPDSSSQGKGVFLFKSLNNPEVRRRLENSPTDMIVQEYIDRPYLIDGYKFDMRIYVTVLSSYPLRAVIFHDGLARFTTSSYEIPTIDNITNQFMHLTNYAINKHSPSFQRNGDFKSKRTLDSVFENIRQTHGNGAAKYVWKNIKDSITKTLVAAQPFIHSTYSKCNTVSKLIDVNGGYSQCFEILGFDVLLDEHLKPWILEVNHSPSFTCDERLDKIVKGSVIRQSVKLACGNTKQQLQMTSQIKHAYRHNASERLQNNKPARQTLDAASCFSGLSGEASEIYTYEFLEFPDNLVESARLVYDDRHKPTKKIEARNEMLRKRIEQAEKEKRAFEQWRKRCAKEYGTVPNTYHSPVIKRAHNDEDFVKMVMVDDTNVSTWEMKSKSSEKLPPSPISSPKSIANLYPVQSSPSLKRRQLLSRKSSSKKVSNNSPPVRVEPHKRLPLLPRQSMSVPCVTIDQLVQF